MFTPNQPDSQNDNNDIDDLFSSPPNNNAPAGPYTPPPPQSEPRRTNAFLYVILGIVIAFLCVCVGCIALAAGSYTLLSRDPTFQSIFASSLSRREVPASLPSDVTAKGLLTAGQQESGQLSAVQQDVWKYKGSPNEKISIQVSSEDRSLPLLIGLYDANGKLLIGNNVLTAFSREQTITFTLTDSTTYSILVTAVGGTANSNGNYNITVGSNAR
jgi:hypothetical protein